MVLIFQPAEEGLAGAKAMLDDGIFERFPVDTVYGVHNMPGMPAGSIAVSPGAVMAAADAFTARIQGQGGHGAMPHLSVDPVVAAIRMIEALQTLVSRETDPHATLVISVTTIHGGDAFNVIPDDVTFGGTVRYFDTEVGERTRQRMHEILGGIAQAHGVEVSLDYKAGYPPTVNHEAESAFSRRVAEEVSGETPPEQPKVMGSEDFSFFLLEKPGAYAFVGNGDEPDHAQIHNPHYDFNDSILPVGASYFARLVEEALPKR